jgi:hypothetical protein
LPSKSKQAGGREQDPLVVFQRHMPRLLWNASQTAEARRIINFGKNRHQSVRPVSKTTRFLYNAPLTL